jgi:hypothetical protein
MLAPSEPAAAEPSPDSPQQIQTAEQNLLALPAATLKSISGDVGVAVRAWLASRQSDDQEPAKPEWCVQRDWSGFRSECGLIAGCSIKGFFVTLRYLVDADSGATFGVELRMDGKPICLNPTRRDVRRLVRSLKP